MDIETLLLIGGGLAIVLLMHRMHGGGHSCSHGAQDDAGDTADSARTRGDGHRMASAPRPDLSPESAGPESAGHLAHGRRANGGADTEGSGDRGRKAGCC